MKKIEAIRRAKDFLPAPITLDPSHFIVHVPADYQDPDGPLIEVRAGSYLEALHARAYAVCRVALFHMGLGGVPLSPADGGTVEQLMRVALDRAAHGSGDEAPVPFWRVRLAGQAMEAGE